jgi:hypothetical protein
MRRLLAGRRLDPSAEQVLFALVANRALAPSSKLAAAGWASDDVAIPGLAATSDDACYRAMDWLLEIHHELEHEVFGQVADLLNLEVYLLFFFFRDTTSTYFELDEPDEPIPRDQRGVPVADGHGQGAGDTGTDTAGFRSYGHPKDHRDDLPQIVVGMAVTRTGIPVRVWCWPGNTGDQALIRQVKQDLRDWTLTRVIWVADRGFASAANRRWLGYKQLLQVERDWRDMKQVLDLRPVYHRKEERIRAHVLLCWLALLLVRTIETSCDDTLAEPSAPAGAGQARHLHRTRRDLPATHRDHEPAARHPGQAAAGRAPARPAAHPDSSSLLTRTNARA